MDWLWRSYSACSFSGFESIKFLFVETLKSIVYAKLIENAELLRNRIEQGFRQIRETPGMIERVTRSMTRRGRRAFKCKILSIFCKSN